MKNRILILLLAVSIGISVICGVAAVNAAELRASAYDDFMAFVNDATRADYTLTGDVDLNGATVTINRRVTLNGDKHKFIGGTLVFENAGNSALNDFGVENANGDAITLKDSANVRLQNLEINNSSGFAIVEKSLKTRTTVSVNLSLIAHNNANGALSLEDNSLFTLAGSGAALDLDNYVYIDEAKKQAYVDGEYRDKNFDKQDKLNVVCLTSAGSFIKRDTDKINVLSFNKSGTDMKCHVLPYDEVAPEVGVIKAPKTAVEGVALDLKSAVEIKDNKSAVEEMVVKFTAQDEGGEAIALTESSDVFVNGSVLTPQKTGKISLKAEVSDEYGNSTMRYIYIDVVKANSTPPVINAGAFKKTYIVGKEFDLPEIWAKNSAGEDLAAVVSITAPDGSAQTVSGKKHLFGAVGSYVIKITAADSLGNTAEKRFYVSAVSEGDTEISETAAKKNVAPVVVLIVLAVCVAGIVVWNVLLYLKTKKS